MNNREIINTYVVTDKLNIDFDSISKMTQYHLDKVCESRVNTRYLLDLVVDKLISFKTFAILGGTMLTNLEDLDGCESLVCTVANTIRKLYNYVDKECVERIINNMIYTMATTSCTRYVDMQRIIKRVCIVNISKESCFKFNNKKQSVDTNYSNDGLISFKLGGYDSNVAMIVIRRNNAEVYEKKEIKNKRDKILLLSNMIANDDFDVLLHAETQDEGNLIKDLLSVKII